MDRTPVYVLVESHMHCNRKSIEDKARRAGFPISQQMCSGNERPAEAGPERSQRWLLLVLEIRTEGYVLLWAAKNSGCCRLHSPLLLYL